MMGNHQTISLLSSDPSVGWSVSWRCFIISQSDLWWSLIRLLPFDPSSINDLSVYDNLPSIGQSVIIGQPVGDHRSASRWSLVSQFIINDQPMADLEPSIIQPVDDLPVKQDVGEKTLKQHNQQSTIFQQHLRLSRFAFTMLNVSKLLPKKKETTEPQKRKEKKTKNNRRTQYNQHGNCIRLAYVPLLRVFCNLFKHLENEMCVHAIFLLWYFLHCSHFSIVADALNAVLNRECDLLAFKRETWIPFWMKYFIEFFLAFSFLNVIPWFHTVSSKIWQFAE